MMTAQLPDTREFAHHIPKNRLVQAMYAWRASGGTDEAEQAVRVLVAEELHRGEARALGLALMLLPDAELYARLWQWIAEASWQEAALVPALMPVVWVLGSAESREFLSQWPDVAWLNELLTASGLPLAQPVTGDLLAPECVEPLAATRLYELGMQGELPRQP